MSHSTRFISNSIVLTGSLAFQRTLTAIFAIVVARLLKVDNFGTYSVIMTLFLIGDFFSDLNLQQFAIREFPRIQQHPEALLSQLITLKLGFSFLVYWFLQIAVSTLGYEAFIREGLAVVALCLFSGAVSGSFSTVFIAAEKPLVPSLIFVFFGVMYTFISILLLWKGASLISIFWTKVIIDILTAVLMYVSFQKRFNWPFVKPELKHLFSLINRAGPFFCFGLIALAQQHADILVLSKFGPIPTNAQVGWYAAARGLLSPILILSQGISVAMLPWLSKRVYFGEEKEKVKKRLMKTSAALFLGAGIPLVIGAFWLGGWVLTTILGNEFLPALPTVHVLSFAFAIQLMNGPIATTMLCSTKLPIFLVYYGFIVLVRVLLSLLFVPEFGHLGVAYANLIGVTLAAVFLLRISHVELR